MTVLRPIAARHMDQKLAYPSWPTQRSAGARAEGGPQLGRGECMAGQARRRRGAGAAATLEGPDALGLRSLVAADRGVLDALVVLQASVAVRLDRRVMHEYIRRSVVGDDKAVAFVRVEPFHCSLSHCDLLPERSSGSTSVHPGLRDRLSLPGRDLVCGRPLSEFAGAVTRARNSTTTALI